VLVVIEDVVVYDVRERVDLDHSLIISNLIICPFGII